MATIEGVEIDLMPTKGMKEEAQRYRDWKADGEAGGTEVAARRATILSGDELSADTVIAMNAWFARHEVDKQGEGFSQRMISVSRQSCMGNMGRRRRNEVEWR